MRSGGRVQAPLEMPEVSGGMGYQCARPPGERRHRFWGTRCVATFSEEPGGPSGLYLLDFRKEVHWGVAVSLPRPASWSQGCHKAGKGLREADPCSTQS